MMEDSIVPFPTVQERLKDCWLVAALSGSLKKKPISVVILERKIVILRFKNKVTAFDDACPHRGFPLSRGTVVGEYLQCSYHGLKFDSLGKCILNPSSLNADSETCRLRSFSCVEQDGFIWISLGNPTVSPPRFPLFDKSKYKKVFSAFRIRGNLFDALENFLDPTHTHFVHKNLIRKEQERKCVQIEVECNESYAQASYLNEGASSGWIQQLFAADIERSIGRFRVPNIVELDYWSPKFLRIRFVLIFTPIVSGELYLHVMLAGRHPLANIVLPLLKPFLRQLLIQDENILHILQDHKNPRYTAIKSDVLGGVLRKWLMKGVIEQDKKRIELFL